MGCDYVTLEGVTLRDLVTVVMMLPGTNCFSDNYSIELSKIFCERFYNILLVGRSKLITDGPKSPKVHQ